MQTSTTSVDPELAMDSDSPADQQPTQILKPRNRGESLKIAETVLRKRNRDIKGLAQRAQKRIDLRKDARRQNLDLGVVTPEKLVKDSLIRQIDSKRFARLRNQKQNPRVKFADRAASIFVVRNARSPTSKSSAAVIQAMGITKKYSATFVPNCSSELLRLRSIHPFVFYGFLTNDLLNILFTKRLRFKRTPKEVTGDDAFVDAGVPNVDDNDNDDDDSGADSFAVTDNVAVEQRLGHLGLLCLEDVIDAVKTCGASFSELMSHVSAFQLCDIMKAEGVEANVIESGDIGFKINAKVSKLM